MFNNELIAMARLYNQILLKLAPYLNLGSYFFIEATQSHNSHVLRIWITEIMSHFYI